MLFNHIMEITLCAVVYVTEIRLKTAVHIKEIRLYAVARITDIGLCAIIHIMEIRFAPLATAEKSNQNILGKLSDRSW